MSQNVTKLTPRKTRAITALLELPTIEQAAQWAGVNPRTIYRWMDNPGFKVALSSAEGRAIDRAARRLVGLSGKALDALESVLDDPRQNGAGNKRLAAVAILDALLKLRELRNIEQRIAALERISAEKEGVR